MKLKKAMLWVVKNPMEIVAAAALLATILITVFNAVTRYTIKYTWNPGTDVCTICFGWAVFCGAAVAHKRKGHMGITILVDMLPEKVRWAFDLLIHIIMAAGLIYVTILAYDLMMNVGGKVLPNTKISYFWFDMSAVVGLGFTAFYEVLHTVEHIKLGKKLKKEEAK